MMCLIYCPIFLPAAAAKSHFYLKSDDDLILNK